MNRLVRGSAAEAWVRCAACHGAPPRRGGDSVARLSVRAVASGADRRRRRDSARRQSPPPSQTPPLPPSPPQQPQPPPHGRQRLLEALQQTAVSSGSRRHPSRLPRRGRGDTHGTLTPRQAAARNLAVLLKIDPAWLDATRERLESTEPSSTSAASSPPLPEALASFYADSLPSFAERLAASPALAAPLERLQRAGLGETGRFARRYWRSLQGARRDRELARDAAERAVRATDAAARAEAAQGELVRIRGELRELEKVRDVQEDTESSLLGRAFQFMQSISQSREEQSLEQSQIRLLQNKKDDLVRLIGQKERLIQTNLALAAAAQQYIDEIETERQHLRSAITLSDKQLDLVSLTLEQEKNIICTHLAQHIQSRHEEMLKQFNDLDAKTDLTRPHEWYPYARLDRRKIIYHGGPTNSGKTFQALERLKQAKRGMYLGPLRLLAAEVFEKLTAAGLYCSLYTGQEILKVPFETHGAATIEMTSLETDYDVVVIDEIQMISDNDRGFAWTRALLGCRCKEIHVCGGLEGKDLVERLTAACGDEFELRTYERFTELTVSEQSLAKAPDEYGSYRAVQSGDCVVAFSRKDIFAIKREIETLTPHKCCVIYGSLPPLTRTEQARRFNDPDSGYDVLVASDAVGMGLNLNIKRIIFNSMYKTDGSGVKHLDHGMVKQISGRAGRRNSPFPDGEVTCRSPDDMQHLRMCMSTPVTPILSAGLVPTAGHIELFHDTLNSYRLEDRVSSLHSILGHFSDMAKLRSDYFLCRQTPMMVVAKRLTKLDLPIRDKYMLCMSPVVETSHESMEVMRKFATKLASREVPGLPHNLRPTLPATFNDLSRLCSIYSCLELFLWLQNKFPPINIMEQQTALSRRETTIEFIGHGLAISDKLKLDHSYIQRDLKLRDTSKVKKKLKENDRTEEWLVEDV